jgi:hypothetical protein
MRLPTQSAPRQEAQRDDHQSHEQNEQGEFHHQPRLGGRAQLLRERKDGIHSVGGVVAAKIADHVADPGYIVARASRGEHGCGETPARCGGVEEDRRFGADELKS